MLFLNFKILKYNTHDLWVGVLSNYLKGTTDRTTNLIVTSRFMNLKYSESPTSVYDPDGILF
jgi:hypothetical protein